MENIFIKSQEYTGNGIWKIYIKDCYNGRYYILHKGKIDFLGNAVIIHVKKYWKGWKDIPSDLKQYFKSPWISKSIILKSMDYYIDGIDGWYINIKKEECIINHKKSLIKEYDRKKLKIIDELKECKMASKTKKVLIEYVIDTDEITVKSEFKDPERTLKLIQMGLEKWVTKYIGHRCPECDEDVQQNWDFCSFCGKKL